MNTTKRCRAIAAAIRREGGSLGELTVRRTPRPNGSWRWQQAYTYGVYHPRRRYALQLADFKIAVTRAKGRSGPAMGWENADRLARAEAETVAKTIQGESQ